MFEARKFSTWMKTGKHRFMIDTTWNKDFKMNELKMYAGTKLGDNWNVGMMIKP